VNKKILPPEKGSATTTTTTTTTTTGGRRVARRNNGGRRNRSHVSTSVVSFFLVQFPFLFFNSFFPTLFFFACVKRFRVLVCIFFLFWKRLWDVLKRKGGTSL
jgi:hypothetical protein